MGWSEPPLAASALRWRRWTTVRISEATSTRTVGSPKCPSTHRLRLGLANWLECLCVLRVELAQDVMRAQEGVVFVAPGDRHPSLVSNRCLAAGSDEPVQGEGPSVDVLFESVASACSSAPRPTTDSWSSRRRLIPQTLTRQRVADYTRLGPVEGSARPSLLPAADACPTRRINGSERRPEGGRSAAP